MKAKKKKVGFRKTPKSFTDNFAAPIPMATMAAQPYKYLGTEPKALLSSFPSVSEDPYAKVDRLQREIKEVRKEERVLSEKLMRLWKDLGVVINPKTLGDYLYGMVAYSEMVTTFVKLEMEKEGFVKMWADDILGHYNFGSHSSFFKAFSPLWRDSGYARVSIGHKLASALMLTSVPEDYEGLKAPWERWILEVPSGLYPFETTSVDTVKGEVRALICEGTEPEYLIVEMEHGGFNMLHLAKDSKDLLYNYSRGVCLSFHERKHVSESRWGKSTYSNVRSSKGPGYGTQFLLSKPITVDFRDVVRDILSGTKRNKGFTSQWPVRGHWRDQACGRGRKDRKPLWIEPYWKGPEETRRLLRGHVLE